MNYTEHPSLTKNTSSFHRAEESLRSPSKSLLIQNISVRIYLSVTRNSRSATPRSASELNAPWNYFVVTTIS